jgi:menaquinone-dependent protoporphyrinogen oxidase
MNVLITAASKHGATAEIAQALADGLTRRGVDAVVHRPRDVHDLRPYDVVVIGSAVYAGRWLAEARALVTRLSDQLVRTQVWLFSSGPVGDPLKPEEDAVDVLREHELTRAVCHRTFAGHIDRAALGFAERAVVRALHVPDGDFRDWADVDNWAATIAASTPHPTSAG